MTESATSMLAERGGDGEMLQITPDDTILFTKFGNELVGTVEIANVAQNSITYKIKTTSPEKFRVKPSTGVLAAGMNTSINVVLLQGQQISSLSKDKFLVMCMSLPSDANTNFQGIADIWKNTPSNSPLVEQHRLKCSLPVNATGDGVKNGRLNGSGYALDADRQISHFSSSLGQLTETTERLEAQLKLTQNLQWITLIVFLVLLMAVVYILKREINRQNAEMCLEMSSEH